MSNKRHQLVRNRYASLDPGTRGGMDHAPSFMSPSALCTRTLWQIILNRGSRTGPFVADDVLRFGENAAVRVGWLQSRQTVFDEHSDHDLSHALRSFLTGLGGNNHDKIAIAFK